MDLQNFYNRSRLSEEDQDLIVRILSEDLSTDMMEMSRRTGIKYTTIRGAYKHLGISSAATREAKLLREQTELMLRIRPLYCEEGMGRREIAAELGVSMGTVQNICEKFELVKGRKPRHGTAVEYDYWKCRCVECREANRLRCYAIRDNLKGRVESGGDVPHGTMTGYWNWECRCDECRAVGSRVNRERVATPVETQWRKGERWVGGEDVAIESYDVTAREIAMGLGRTVGGVNARRSGRGVRRKEVLILSGAGTD
jgi:hypothetical protein